MKIIVPENVTRGIRVFFLAPRAGQAITRNEDRRELDTVCINRFRHVKKNQCVLFFGGTRPRQAQNESVVAAVIMYQKYNALRMFLAA